MFHTPAHKQVAAAAQPEMIFEFVQADYGIMGKHRCRTEAEARAWFERELPEWADRLQCGDVKIKSRAPRY